MSKNAKDEVLMPNLSLPKKAMLLQTSSTPGFQVVVEMANEAVLQISRDISKLDPEGPDYERKVVERGRRARNISEGFDLLFMSIFAHADSLKKAEAQEDQEAVDAVNKTLGVANSGIHLADPKQSADAIRKTFGIHSAIPEKKAAKK